MKDENFEFGEVSIFENEDCENFYEDLGSFDLKGWFVFWCDFDCEIVLCKVLIMKCDCDLGLGFDWGLLGYLVGIYRYWIDYNCLVRWWMWF